MRLFRHMSFLVAAIFFSGCSVVIGLSGQVLLAADKPSLAEAVYFCPMHPQVVSQKPGECPICHMRLVKREESERDQKQQTSFVQTDSKSICLMHDCPMEKAGKNCSMFVMGVMGETVECPHCRERMNMSKDLVFSSVPAGYASVLITAQKQQLIGIRTETARKKELRLSIDAPARVVNDPELYQAQVEFLKEYRMSLGTLRNRELAFKNLYDSRWEAPRVEIAKSKLFLMGMDEASIQEIIENAKADDSLLFLKSDAPVWIYADAAEADAAWIQKGDRAVIRASSLPGKKYESMVHNVSSVVEPENRRVRVRVKMDNDGVFKPGMFLDVTFEPAAGEGIAVNREAVFFTGQAAIVFVDKANGLFEPREVKVGIRAGQEFQILSGLTDGEKIVVNGNFLLDSESRLKASIEQAALAHAGHKGDAND